MQLCVWVSVLCVPLSTRFAFVVTFQLNLRVKSKIKTVVNDERMTKNKSHHQNGGET